MFYITALTALAAFVPIANGFVSPEIRASSSSLFSSIPEEIAPPAPVPEAPRKKVALPAQWFPIGGMKAPIGICF
jgi:hypothetical protein